MKAFSERNPITIAVVSILTLAAVGAATFYAEDLPIIGGGTTYTANFGDAAALKSGDDVRIAGVKVGSVSSIDLVSRHVKVEFKVKDAWVGDQSTVGIKIKTLLGQEFLDIDPLGQRSQDPDSTIPLGRTTTPLDVSQAVSGLSNTLGSIDTAQLAKSFDTLSATFADTPASVRVALTGLSRLSTTISSRDAQLQTLAKRADSVTGTVAASSKNFEGLINDGALLLQELRARSQAITDLLNGTRDFARNLSGLVRDNDKTIGPALAQLSRVTTTLTDNQSNLKKALTLIGPYYGLLNDAAGNGPWLDIYVCGLFNGTTPVLDANAKRNCAPSGAK